VARRPTALLVALTLALLALPAAQAGAAFTLTAPASASFGTATLTGADITDTFTLPLTVVDTRATPTAGWNLTIRATQFTAAGGKTLPATADTVTSVARVCSTGPCVNPTNAIATPVAVPVTPAVKFYNAAATTGTGTFTITPTVTVAIPANTLTGTYSSTVTTSLVSGP
jgi:hypothetical protein